jgi:hypothetical protein
LSGSAPALTVAPGDSHALRAWLWALHAAAFAGLAALALPLGVRALLAAALAGAALLRLRSGPARARHLDLRGDGQCLVVDARGACVRGALDRASLTLPGLVIVALRDGSGRRYCHSVPADALAPADLRRLRVRVRALA